MAKVENVQVTGLEQAIFRSGYPMRGIAPTEEEFKLETAKIKEDIRRWNPPHYLPIKPVNPHINRAISLASKAGGHDQFLTGITVDFDLTLSNKAWVEAERYKFLNFVSSMSTMHRVSEMSIADHCNCYASATIVKALEDIQKAYLNCDGAKDPVRKIELRRELLYNLPSGFEITAGMTTNYRCLKNMYAQREHHFLPDWHVVCKFIRSLPMADEFLTGASRDAQ